MTGGQGTFRSLVTSRDYAAGNSRGYVLYAGNDNNWQFWTGNGSWEVLDGPAVTLQPVDAPGRKLRRGEDAPVRERRPCRLPGRATCKTSMRPLRVARGNTDGAADFFLPGRVDEVAVYGGALSAARVSAHYAAASSGGGGNQPPNALAGASPTSGTVPLASTSPAPARAILTARSPPTPGISTATAPTTTRPSRALLHICDCGYIHGGPAGDRQPRRPGRLRPHHDQRPESRRRNELFRHCPRRLAASYWRLGEATGTTAADASGKRARGHLPEYPHARSRGALSGDSNTAGAFNGTNEYVHVPFAGALNPASFTVEAWAFVTGGQGTFRSLVTSRDYAAGNARGYVLYAGNDNKWQFWTGNGTWEVLEGLP